MACVANQKELSVEAITTGNEVAIDPVGHTVHVIGDKGLVAIEAMRLDIAGFIDRHAASLPPAVHQVERKFGLTVNDHRLAAEAFQIDPLQPAREGQADTVVYKALRVHARPRARFVEKSGRTGFQHTGADAAKNVVPADTIENDIFNPALVSNSLSRRPDGPDPMTTTWLRNGCPPLS